MTTENNQASQAYRDAYDKGQEYVPDYVYDTMFEQTETALDDIGQGELIDHMHPMLSLPTYFMDIEHIDEAILASTTGVTKQYSNITLSYKLDGVPGSCILGPQGWLRSVSRGKRFKGFVMNDKFLSILPKPKQLPDHEIDFRGEYVISKADFVMLNSKLPDDAKYANPRSMVSAQINSNEPDPEILSHIKWFAHAIWDDQPNAMYDRCNYDHFSKLMCWLNQSDICHFLHTVNILHNDANYCINKFYDEAMNYDYPCDGIVLQYRNTDANDGRCNLDRIAIKQFDEAKFSGQTTVKSIEWRLANNGSYFPRIWFEPVKINGLDVLHAAGYCWDYVQRMGLSIGASVVVTLRGGVIPYVSKVLHIGNGNYQLPTDAAKPEQGDMQLWSTNSEDAIRRLKFVRGMQMLDLKDCGVQMFNDMYDAGMHSIFDVAELVQNGSLQQLMLQTDIIQNTKAGMTRAMTIIDRFKTFNYVWCILALREDQIGFAAANFLGQCIAGYTMMDNSPLNRQAIRAFLDNKELVMKVMKYSNPVALEHADLSAELHMQKHASGKPKACMSKKPSNGMKKQDFAATYLADYDITENIKEAQVLICPRGEQSNKINYAKANDIEIKFYEDFIQ